MDAEKKVPLSEDSHRNLLHCQEELNELLMKKFRCATQLMGPNPGASPAVSAKAAIVYEKRVLMRWPLVSVWKDDLTRQVVDVVVNAANENLIHGAGLALALVNAGGPVIVQDSKDYISRYGRLQAGDVAVTRAGALPSKTIVHAVGPQWLSTTPERSSSDLKKVIWEVLDYVTRKRDVASVAIPAVSSGIFGFPLDLCADIIVMTVRKFIDSVPCDHLKEIRLVNHDDKTVQAMKAACERVLGISDTFTGATPLSTKSPRPSAPGPPPPPVPNAAVTVTVHSVNLHLIRGCIEKQNTTVVVNSVSSDLHLSSGAISKAIVNAAGSGIQQEIYRKRRRDAIVITTRGHRLPCDFVYHVILQGSEEVLRQATHKCLCIAHFHHAASISFPALGTGNIGLPKKRVARVMTETVLDFARSSSGSMDVFFVIHPNDTDTFQAFQAEFPQDGSWKTMENRGSDNLPLMEAFGDEERYAIITGHCAEEVAAAEELMVGLVRSQAPVIRNNHILLLGKEEHEALASGNFTSVSIEESLDNGSATMTVEGAPHRRVKAAVQVERLLLDVQEKHAEALEAELLEAAVIWFYENKSQICRYSAKANREIERAFASSGSVTLRDEPRHVINTQDMSAEGPSGVYHLQRRCIAGYARLGLGAEHLRSHTETVKESEQLFKGQKSEFRKAGLTLLKMEKVTNRLLSAVYDSKKTTIEKRCKNGARLLYQLVPSGLQKMICDVGFHRLYAASTWSGCCAGIHFKNSLYNIWRSYKAADDSGLMYIFQAEVLTGTSTEVTQGQPVLPPRGRGDPEPCDSVTDYLTTSPEHFLLFDCFRARPLYMFTCRREDSSRHQDR